MGAGQRRPARHALRSRRWARTRGIIRCRRCRTYINPFVEFVQAGQRWKCNVCGLINEVPCRIGELTTTKTGKHGHCKVGITTGSCYCGIIGNDERADFALVASVAPTGNDEVPSCLERTRAMHRR